MDTDRGQGDRAALMQLHVQLVPHLQMREFHQRGVKDDALRIAHLGNGLCHDVILCFTDENVKSLTEKVSRTVLYR